MHDPVAIARAHYDAAGLTARIREALEPIAPDGQPLTVASLAALDQFHTRGLLATKDLAAMTSVRPETRVLDLGCGIGGPARYLAATFGCRVTGVDLSESFIEAAAYLTGRCALQSRVTFEVGNALDLPFEAGAFDLVLLQHVAMNIDDRRALYAETRRVLAPGGRLAIYDVVLRGDVRYPVPWAREASASFLLTEEATRDALAASGFDVVAWRDDTDAAKAWSSSVADGGPPPGPTLGLVLGPDFAARVDNLRRNLDEGRIGILSAVVQRR